MFIAATVPVAKAGDVNELLEAAKTIGDPAPAEVRKAPVPNGPFNPEVPPDVDNGDGSFERFMLSFGSPRRWAGR